MSINVVPKLPSLRYSIIILFKERIILWPFCWIIFLQTLILEILYFIPRFPLNIFFAPLIRKIWAEEYLHYPFNFILVTKLFQQIQLPLYIFVNYYLIACSVAIIKKINNHQKISIGKIFRETWGKHYIHLVVAASLSLCLLLLLLNSYEILLNRAWLSHPSHKLYQIIRTIIISGGPYFNLLINVAVTTLFAYVIPIIIIDDKKVFSAIVQNFKTLFRSLWFTFKTVLLASSFFIPIILLKNMSTTNTVWPESNIIILVAAIIVMAVIDAVIYTTITITYLAKKELN